MSTGNASSASSAIQILPAKSAFDESVKQLCFEIWLFLADRNAEDTVRLLEQRMQDVAPEESFPQLDRIPSVRTVQNWAKVEDWAHKANDLIRDTAKHIDESQIARLFIMSDEAINFAHRLIRGDFDHFHSPGVLAVRWDAAKEMLRFRGLGTAGVVGAPVSLKVEVSSAKPTDVLDGMTTDQMAEFMRQRTLDAKQTKRLTGKAAKS
jgi:hypothetical protein